MGIVLGSVVVPTGSSSSPANVQVTMPENEMDIIGFAPAGNISGPLYAAPLIVGIYIDASNIAFFPLPNSASFTVRKYSPIHVHVKGNVLNLYIPGSNSALGLTIYYGIPDGSEIEYTELKGVITTVTNSSTTANASGTLNVTFPTGNVTITGLFLIGINNAQGQISMTTGTGKNLYVPFADTPDPMDLPNNIIPLQLSSSTQLSINYNMNYNSSGNTELFLIIYYQ